MREPNDAQSLLAQLSACLPHPLLHDLDAVWRGAGLVLSTLEHTEKEICAGDLARIMEVSSARIAALLRRMDRDGLVTRRASSDDARRTIVTITPAGRDAIDALRAQALRRVELLLAAVGREELETYIRISQRIRSVLEKAAGDGETP